MKEVVVISTTHKSTKKYCGNDIVSLLERVRPSLILEELPPDFFTQNGNKVYPKRKQGQESIAIKNTYANIRYK